MDARTPVKKRRVDATSPAASRSEGRSASSPSARGYRSNLHRRYLGVPLTGSIPRWFNDAACGAVSGGTQIGLTCGLFAVNHCLTRSGLPITGLAEFRERAGDGCYAEGEFDNSGLQRNIQAKGCFFEQLQGEEYEQAVRQLDEHGHISIFNGRHALGCIIHMPNPRHWIALVPPVQQRTAQVAALLCDSLQRQPYASSVDEVVVLFATMALRHLQFADMDLPTEAREQLAAGWSVYRVTL